METRDAILRRRSIRKYKDTPISDEDLQEIMECGMYAPSASNLQPWHFVVVKSPDKKKKVEELMGLVIHRPCIHGIPCCEVQEVVRCECVLQEGRRRII